MDELTLDGKIYISSKQAAKMTGYAKDYVGQLCREGRVEARLVGRNWYILESSIKEHRFGAEPVEASVGNVPAEPVEDTDWKASNYVSETPSQLPTVDPEPVSASNSLPDTSYNPTIGSSPAIEEMQSAWHDWFSRTNELKITQETLIESPEVIEEREVVIEEQPGPIQADEEFPVAIERVTEVIEEYPEVAEEIETEEEVIPIHRTYAAPMRPVAPIRPTIETYMPQYSVPVHAAPTHGPRREAPIYEAPMGRIISERRVVTRKKPSLFLRTLFIGIAVLAIVIGALGSGKAEQFIGNNLSRYNVIEFFSGEKSFDKLNK